MNQQQPTAPGPSGDTPHILEALAGPSLSNPRRESNLRANRLLLSDAPTRDDQLGYKDYTKALLRIIRNLPTEAPWTIGVFGEWGSGKSSLLQMLEASLEPSPGTKKLKYRPEQKTRTVCLNVWQLSNQEEIWAALLQAVLLQIKAKTPWHKRLLFNLGLLQSKLNWKVLIPRLAGLLVSVGIAIVTIYIATANSASSGVTAGTTALSALVLGWFTFLQPYIREVGQRVKVDLTGLVRASPLKERVSVLHQFKAELQQSVFALVGKQGRLVVIIDDLDRCSPEHIVQVLDAIKLFLDVENCVFLIGLDRQIVEAAVRAKFKDYKEPDIHAREYLHKIIQLPFELPPLQGESMKEFVDKLNQATKLPPGCSDVFALGQRANPRAVKRTINTFQLLRSIAEQRPDFSIKPVLLAKLVVIQHNHRDLYELLVAHPRALADLEDHYHGRTREAPKYLRPYAHADDLKTLLTLELKVPDTNFTIREHGIFKPLPQEELWSYISFVSTRALAAVPKLLPTRIFVNRQEELKAFTEMIEDRSKKRILLVTAEPGGGKSALLEQYKAICREQGVGVARCELGIKEQTVATCMRAILNELNVAPQIVDRIRAASLSVKRIEPSQIFTDILSEVAADGKVALLFDTCELASKDLTAWISGELLQNLRNIKLQSVIAVVAGRETSAIERDLSNLQDLIVTLTLRPLAAEHVAEYVNALRPELSEKEIVGMQTTSGGNPVVLAANLTQS